MKGHSRSRFTGEWLLQTGAKTIGGKCKSRDFLYQLMPDHDLYFEPFGGSANVLCGKAPSNIEIVGDLNEYIVNFFNVIQDTPEEFWNKWLEIEAKLSSEVFFERRDNLHLETDALEKALSFYVVMKLANNGIVRFRKDGKCNSSYCKQTNARGLYTREWFDKVRARLEKVFFRHQDYKETLALARSWVTNYDRVKSLTFLDSPYHNVKTTYIGDYWKKPRFIEYASEVAKLNGNWLMTINDTPFIRELFKEYSIVPHELYYSSSNTPAGRGLKKELIIANYDLEPLVEKAQENFNARLKPKRRRQESLQ